MTFYILLELWSSRFTKIPFTTYYFYSYKEKADKALFILLAVAMYGLPDAKAARIKIRKGLYRRNWLAQ